MTTLPQALDTLDDAITVLEAACKKVLEADQVVIAVLDSTPADQALPFNNDVADLICRVETVIEQLQQG